MFFCRLMSFAEFTNLITDVLNRMQAQLPQQILHNYCNEYKLSPTIFHGVDQTIHDKLRAIDRSALAKQLFDLIDQEKTGSIQPHQLKALHRCMETHVLKGLYDSIGTIMVDKQMAAYDRL